MTFLIKFLVKGIALFALEAGETIFEIASHLVSPAKLGYQLATHIDLFNPEDKDAAQTKTSTSSDQDSVTTLWSQK